MRLPFGLGRRSSSGDGASGGGGSSSGTATVPSGAAAPSRAWASLPPIQRTTGDMPLVAAPGSFAEALPGSHGLPPIVEPLGHEVSALATPGLIVARSRPVSVSAPGSIPAPVQRRAARGGSRSAAVAAPSPAPEPDVAEHVAHEAPAVAATPAPLAVSMPVRSMPTVSRSAVRVPDRPLTSAAAAARPAAVQRAAVAAAAGAGSPASGAPLPPAVSGGMRRVPTTAPAVAAVVSRQASASHAEPAASAPTPSAKPSRAGVGEPLTAVPASARPITSPGPVVSRSTTSGPMPIAASSLRSPAQRSASATPPTSALPGPSAPSGAAPAAGLSVLPHLPVARSTAGASPSAAPAATVSVRRTPAADGAPRVRPIAGANPIRTAFSLQRDAAEDLDDGQEDDGALPSPWWAPAGEGAGHAPMGDGAGATGLAIPLQRSTPDGGASASTFGGPGRAPSQLHGGAGAPIQRAAASTPRPSLPALSLLRDPGHRASDAGASSVTFPAAAGPVVQSSLAPAASPTGARIVGAPATGPVVQRDGTVPISAPASVPPGGPAAPASPAGAAGPAGPAAPSGQGRSERDLDELAQALFGRIRGRLRSDLIYDREAKGLTFDNV